MFAARLASLPRRPQGSRARFWPRRCANRSAPTSQPALYSAGSSYMVQSRDPPSLCIKFSMEVHWRDKFLSVFARCMRTSLPPCCIPSRDIRGSWRFSCTRARQRFVGWREMRVQSIQMRCCTGRASATASSVSNVMLVINAASTPHSRTARCSQTISLFRKGSPGTR